MLFASDFRKIARDGLKGKWILAVLTCIVAYFFAANPVWGTGTSIEFNVEERNVTTSAAGPFDERFWYVILTILTGFAVVSIIYLIFVIILGGAVTLGYCKFNLNLVDRKNPRFEDIFSEFDRLGAGFCVQFLRGLYIFLWSLLFVIPGIIARYSYSMSAYILQEHPEMTASEAIATSKELMSGNKWRFFCLELSFIGWDLLSLFTFGIGYLFLSPYKEAAYAAFYREVSGTIPRVHVYTEYEEQPDGTRTYYHEV